MHDLLYLSITIGLLINLISVDLFGVILGGFFVPGYLALEITKPLYVSQILLIALATVAIVRLLSNFMIIYGRKMLVMSVLVGYLLNFGIQSLDMVTVYTPAAGYFGLIIPGLMAYWMQRQGIFMTFMMSILGAIIVRLLLVLVTGGTILL